VTNASIAVVVPTLNEAATIAACLEHLAAFDLAEIIVSDGGSQDATRAISREFPNVRVINGPRGRGTQLKAGVAATSAPLLILLHADTRLPAGADRLIRQVMADPSVAGGCFRLTFDSKRRSLALSAWFTRLETELTSFGDQAFFMRRSALHAAGGIADWPLLEDVDMRRKLRRVGRFVKLPAAVVTSARRFDRDGVLRCQLRNAYILLALKLGVSPHRLARIYRSTRTGTGPVPPP
jgi:rSAM/selenodomain-associated transferase 2